MTERLVYAAVAIPGEPDYDGEILTPEEIEYAAHKYISDHRVVDPEHSCAKGYCIEVGKPVESYITPQELKVKSVHDNTPMTIPKRSWIIGVDVTDDSSWDDINSGKKKGVSLTAGRSKGATKSKVLIRDLGKDWEATTVSLVKDPAVPKAKFFSISTKSSDTMTEENKRFNNFINRIDDAIKSFKSEEENSNEGSNDDAIKSNTETNEQEFVTVEKLDAMKSELKTEVVDAVKSILESNEDTTKSNTENSSEEEDSKDEKIEQLEKENAELKKKLQTASKSKGLDAHNEPQAVKNLYEDDGRDMYGRLIKR